jgi:hypothetical protein
LEWNSYQKESTPESGRAEILGDERDRFDYSNRRRTQARPARSGRPRQNVQNEQGERERKKSGGAIAIDPSSRSCQMCWHVCPVSAHAVGDAPIVALRDFG